MQHLKEKAFTLVELIVVVTILAILATIGFVSYSSYLTGVRDTNRLAQLVSIHDGLILYSTNKDLPLPDESVEVLVNGNLIAYQGTAGSNTLETIDFTKGGQDPRDKTFFSYYLTDDRKHFQLLGFLEESVISGYENKNIFMTNTIENTHAIDYESRIPTVYGRKLGIITNSENQPLEQSGTGLNITSDTTGYKAYLSETNILETTELQNITPNASCQRLKESKGETGNGIYELSNDGGTTQYMMYCHMVNLKENVITEKMQAGTGNQGKYEYRGRVGESERILHETPFGGSDIVWRSISDGDSGDRNEGGFEYELGESLDKTKNYRFSVWVKKTGSAVGRVYFGTKGNTVQLIGANSAETNPYFTTIDPIPQVNEWYLYVGYVHTNDYSGVDKEGGIYLYDKNLSKLENNSASYLGHRDFEHSSIDNVNINLRVFGYDNFNTSDIYYFYDPRIEISESRNVGDVSDLIP